MFLIRTQRLPVSDHKRIQSDNNMSATSPIPLLGVLNLFSNWVTGVDEPHNTKGDINLSILIICFGDIIVVDHLVQKTYCRTAAGLFGLLLKRKRMNRKC